MLADVEITGLQKMLELVSFRQETQAHTRLMFAYVAANMAGGITYSRKWREPGRQAPGQYCIFYSVAKFHF
jgi:hypothetical protein